MTNEFPQAVTIAGSDCGGASGMQADLHAFFRRGVFGAAILTGAVAENSYGVQAVVPLPLDFIDAEFKAIADDYAVRAAKTGMLADTSLIRTVARNLNKYDFGPLVVDPVITTKQGNRLLKEAAFETLKRELIPLATVITPNFYEAQLLAEMKIVTDEDQRRAARKLQALGADNVVVKGRHDSAEQQAVRDFLLLADGREYWLEEPYVATDRVNGTGDVLSATIAAELARGRTVLAAVRAAKRFVHQAIAGGIAVGHRYGPIDYWAGK
ncbi:MAG: bifunctional hydroxymethylpyrimidine kinase/phosphomethylpyrimidine kinase [Sporolactobacillus sp.]|nr:bifunctional hydroxymethylpyrimidine kinase/phosphomethylpyrimidine kinase [Sporolactobacillus sp.]